MIKKRYVPLELRVARNLLILAAMAALIAGMVRFPAWRQERFVRASMRAHGLSGEAPVLWEGDVYTGTGYQEVRLYAEENQIYASWIEFYEGRPYVRASGGILPAGPVAAPISPELSWTAVRNKSGGGMIFQLMAVDLPEKAVGGRLTVETEWGGSRSIEGEREQGIIPFYPDQDWLKPDLRETTAWTLGGYGSLKDSAYTLTLWDSGGAVISETGGTLESIWEVSP